MPSRLDDRSPVTRAPTAGQQPAAPAPAPAPAAPAGAVGWTAAQPARRAAPPSPVAPTSAVANTPLSADAQAALRSWMHRGDAPRTLGHAALVNELGTALLLQPNHEPQTPIEERALNAGVWSFFQGAQLDAIAPVRDSVVALGGGAEPTRVTALPVLVTDPTSKKTVQVPLFRVDSATGQTAGYVDNLGRRYLTLDQWRNDNKLPAAQLSYPAGGHLVAGPDGLPLMTHEPSHAVIDTPLEQVEHWAEQLGTVAGFVVGGAALVGVGGVAVPLAGAALAIGFGGKAVLGLVDAVRHGQTIDPLKNSQARNDWLTAIASAAGLGATAATALAARELAATGEVSTALSRTASTLSVGSTVAGVAQTVDGTAQLVSHWKDMPWKDRLYATAQMAFFAASSAHAAKGEFKRLYSPDYIRPGGARAGESKGSEVLQLGDRYKAKLTALAADGTVSMAEAKALIAEVKKGNYAEVKGHYLAGFVESAKAKCAPGVYELLSRFVTDEVPALTKVSGDTGRTKLGTGQPTLTDDSLEHHVVWSTTKAGAQLTVDGISADDPLQGNVGDCYFIASLSALAQARPQLLEQAMRANADGTYTVTFHSRAAGAKTTTPVQVTVDGTFPTRAGQPEYASARNSKELWPLVMEKAYAKWKGSYDGIEGGMAATALEALTGKRGDFTPLTSAVDAEGLFQKLNTLLAKKGCVVALSNGFGSGEHGLVDDHAYTVLAVAEHDGKKVVQLRNPWGQSEPGHDGKDDGIFWLPYDRFLQAYSTVETLQP